MSVLPSFKAAFSSYAEDEQKEEGKGVQLPPLPIDLVSGEAPAFGFGRLPKVEREELGGGKRGAAVHAGAYKRPRVSSVSGGSYVMGGVDRVWGSDSLGRGSLGIVEDSGGRDVLSSVGEKSVGSAGLVRGVIGGPTRSDLSVVLGGTTENWRQGGEKEESVQCPHCDRKLRNQVTLQNHVRVVHDHSGNFRCEQCGFTFMWRSTLQNHVRLVHEKQRPYACDECAKAFRWKSHLKEHVWVVHKGEKPFKCETCGKMFGRKNNMQKHMRKHNINNNNPSNNNNSNNNTH